MDFNRFHDFFYTIAKETGGIEGLFHAMFHFLFMKTDFFYEADPGDKMGFPPGKNQQILFNIFQQYQEQQYKKMPKKSIEDYQAKLEEYKKQQEKLKEVQQKEIKPEEQKQASQVKTEGQKEVTSNVTQKSTEQIAEKKEVSIQQTNPTQQKEVQQISTYNGGKTEKYSWSQSINDVTIQVDLPQGTKARNLLVEIKSNSLKVIIKSENKELINGEFYDKVKTDDSIWQVEDQKSLLITLEKAQENIWKTVIKGDEEIDTTKVDNSKKLEEFDPETQGALRKIMYEQQRKQMGLPTTEEEEQQELLKKAWDAEGSPFKGQPFDPSKLNLSQGQNFNLPPQN